MIMRFHSLALLFTLGVVGCPAPESAPACRTNADCPATDRCLWGQCVLADVDAGRADDAGASDAGGGDAGGLADAGPDSGGARDVIGPTRTDLTPSGPVTLTTGMTVTGLRITTTSGPCIVGHDVHDIRITDNVIGPCGPDAQGIGVSLENAYGVRVDHNSFDDVASAFYVNDQAGGGDDLVFDHNRATRIRGPFPRGQLVQFNTVRGAGNRVVCNISDQTSPGYLVGPEDHINMFVSSGTPESPILIAYNRIRGGGPSRSGGGILAGDNTSAYIDLFDNVLVDPGQYGVAIAGGTHIRVRRNRIYAPDVHPWSNIGLYVWNQTEGAACSDHEVSGNRVFYVRDEGPNHSWNAGNCGAIAGWSDNVWGDDALTAAMFDESIPECE